MNDPRPLVDGQDPAHFEQVQAEALELVRGSYGFLLATVERGGEEVALSICLPDPVFEPAVVQVHAALGLLIERRGWGQ